MKKFSRVLAVLLTAVMVISALGGCNKASKQTMFTVMEEGNSFEQYSYEVKVNMKSNISGMDDVTLTLFGEMDNEAASLGVKLNYLYLTLNVKDLMVITKDAMYLNVEKLFDSLASAPLLLGESYTLEDFEKEIGVQLRSIKLPLADGMVTFGANEDASKFMTSVLEAALKDVKITDNKGEYTVSIEDAEQFADFVDNYITALLDNKDEFIRIVNDMSRLDEDKMSDMLELYVDEILDAVSKFSSEYDLGLTSDQIASAKEEALKQIKDGMAEVEVDLNDTDSLYEEMFDELKDSRKELVDSIKDSDVKVTAEITDGITGKKGERVYTYELKLDMENEDEEINLSILTEMTEQKDVSVSVPKNTTSVSDLFYAAMVFAYENDMLDMDDLLPIEGNGPAADPDVQKQPETPAQSNPTGNDTITIGTGNYCVNLEYDEDVLVVKDSSSADSGDVIFAPANSQSTEIELIFAPQFTVEEAIDTILSEVKDYITENKLVDTENVDGNVVETYRCVVSDTSETLEVWFYAAELSNTDAILIAYAFGDELKTAGVDPEKLADAIFDGITDLSTGSTGGSGSGSSGGSGSSPAGSYDGSITLVDSWENESVVINYDKTLVYPDEEYSSPETGTVCFNSVEDEYCYLFVNYDSELDSDDYYDNQKNDYKSFDGMKISEMTARKVGGVVVNEFTIQYTSSTGKIQEIVCFAVEAEEGIVYGDYYPEDFDANSVLSYDEILAAIFQSVK